MMTRALSVLSFGLFVFTLGCAKPNYQKIDPPNQTQVTKPGDENPNHPTPPTPPSCALFFKTEQICVQYKWTKPQTSLENMGEFDLSFYKLETPDLKVDPGLKPGVKLWMQVHGHGSRPVVITKTDTGLYHVSKVFFSMPGVWQIQFQLLNSSGQPLEEISDEVTFHEN